MEELASLLNVPILQGTTGYGNGTMEIESPAQLGKFWRVIQGNNNPVNSSVIATENTTNWEEAVLDLIKRTIIKMIALELQSFPDPSNPNDSVKKTTNGTAQQLWKYLESKYLKKEGITSFYKFGVLFHCTLVDDGTLK